MDYDSYDLEGDHTLLKIFNYCITKTMNDSTGHDHWHHYRVYRLSRTICSELKASPFPTYAAALLHDIHRKDQSKGLFLHYGKEALNTIKLFLLSIGINEIITSAILEAIQDHEVYYSTQLSPEAKALQDADRLDALGAIGIARCFAFTGANGLSIWNPEEEIKDYDPKESNIKSAITHFSEKLFKLENAFHSKTANIIAQTRIRYMKDYVAAFRQEWNC